MILVITLVLKILGIVVPLLIAVAYFTIAERKIMGAIQRRRGPNVVGYIGLLQPFADGLNIFSSLSEVFKFLFFLLQLLVLVVRYC